MARDAALKTATTDFFICIGAQQVSTMAAGGRKIIAFAAFGQVVRGMAVVRAIHVRPQSEQHLTSPVTIERARIINRTGRVALARSGASTEQEHVVRRVDNNGRCYKESALTRFEIFRRLHHAPPILRLPNCWDPASARIYEVAGFPAIATSSAAVANALGAQDGEALDITAHLAAITRITGAVTVPVSVDFESGYADDIGKLARNIGRLAATGAAGFNLEDSRQKGELYPLDEQCARIAAAKTAAPFLFLNARTDIFLDGIGDEHERLAKTKERLAAYLGAGADGIFVPGISDEETISDLAHSFRKKPLNVLAGPSTPPVTELERFGVSRVSIGSWPMRRAMSVVREMARELVRDGTFGFMRDASIPYDEMNALFTR